MISSSKVQPFAKDTKAIPDQVHDILELAFVDIDWAAVRDSQEP